MPRYGRFSSPRTTGATRQPIRNCTSLHDVGNPIVDISEDGWIFIEKIPSASGVVSPATSKEQLLYGLQDPANYFCPPGGSALRGEIGACGGLQSRSRRLPWIA